MNINWLGKSVEVSPISISDFSEKIGGMTFHGKEFSFPALSQKIQGWGLVGVGGASLQFCIRGDLMAEGERVASVEVEFHRGIIKSLLVFTSNPEKIEQNFARFNLIKKEKGPFYVSFRYTP